MSENDKKTTEAAPQEATTPRNLFEVDVELPSRGRFYGDTLPGGIVTIRPITVDEEKLFSASGSKLAVADKILEKCIVSKCVPLCDMLMTDKYYLFLNLRSSSYGSEYLFKQRCKACGTVFNHSVMLPTGLTLKMATEDDTEPYDVKLPVSGKTLSLRFLRGSDEKAVEDFISQLPSADSDEGDPAYAFRLARHIAKMDGEDVDSLEKLNFCESMIGKDSLKMRQAIATHETGADLSIESTCPGCRKVIVSSLPLTDEFFPSSVS